MKKLISLFLAVIMLFSLVSCVPSNTGTTAKPNGDTPTASFPVKVTDHAGREVTIEKMPEKLVSGYYISTSALIALDLDSKLVGIEAKANSRAIYKLSAPSLIELPNVGTAKEFNLEGCLALNPDLDILEFSAMPAVLVEMGFISNSTDAALMSEHPELFAKGIYNGILEYFGFLPNN